MINIMENINNLIFDKALTIIFDDNNFWFCVNEISNLLGYIDKNICIDYITHRINKNYIKTYIELQNPNNIIFKLSTNIIYDTTIFINKIGIYQLIILSKFRTLV